MFLQIDDLLTAAELRELNRVAETSRFVDGRISNPNNKTKNNLQLYDEQARLASAGMMHDALMRSEEFCNFAFPRTIAPPLISVYRPGMHYGMHSDTAFMAIDGGTLRADLSCTIFLSPPESYEGGALFIQLGTVGVQFKPPAGSAIVYPSTTLHAVTPVARGERRVGLTFIQSRIGSAEKREWLYELNEVAALEGLKMRDENFQRMQRIRMNLLREWGDPG